LYLNMLLIMMEENIELDIFKFIIYY
jgi:hypothetical protein